MRQSNNTKRGKVTCLVLFLFIFLFSITTMTTVSAEYNVKGNERNDYYLDGEGNFNNLMSDEIPYIRALSPKTLSPPLIIEDYPNTNKNVILAPSGQTVRAYTDRELNLLEDFNTDYDIRELQYYNYNGGDFILSHGINNRTLQVYRHDGNTTWQNLNNYTFVNYLSQNTKIAGVKCDDTIGVCMTATYYRQSANPFTTNSYVHNFAFSLNDSTGTYHNLSQYLYRDASSDLAITYPELFDIGEYDFDGNTATGNFVYTYSRLDDVSETNDVYLVHVVTNTDGEITSESQYNIFEAYYNPSYGVQADRQGEFFTSPLIVDVDSNSPLDTVTAGMTSSNEFRMYAYKSDGSYIDRYPQGFVADGKLLSNPFRANVFGGQTGEFADESNTFCVLGYETDNNILDLLCGSEAIPEILGFGNSNEAFYNNYTFDDPDDSYKRMVHVSEHLESDPANELLTSFGIIQVDGDELNFIYTLPYTDGVLIDGDVEGTGLKDLIYMTKEALIYIDDGFTNSNAAIDGYTINPCLDGTWKQNTTVSVSVTVKDPNEDKVQARAILYYDYPNENVTQDSNWSTNVSSGSPVSFSFDADTKATGATLRIMGRDAQFNDTGDIIDFTFSVADDGLEFGDCVTSATGLSEPDDDDVDDDEVELALDDNDLTDFIDGIEQGLGVPFLLIFLIGIIFIDIVIFAGLHGIPIVAIAVIVLIDFISFVVASLMGLLPVAFVISMYIVFIILGVGLIMLLIKNVGNG